MEQHWRRNGWEQPSHVRRCDGRFEQLRLAVWARPLGEWIDFLHCNRRRSLSGRLRAQRLRWRYRFHGSFDFGNTAAPGLMDVQINNLVISLGEAISINLGAVDLHPGQATILSATNVSVTANLFSGLQSFPLPTFDLTQSGFSLGDFTISTSSGATIGNFIAVSGPSIDVNNFSVDTQASPVISGSITATAQHA